ncbi:hypothetical protein AMATHDRAFT_10122 [Amanita thiersii Skay4041]|uniref:Uncharacterized protein n=1 Tax=Amanita thiersii Skay4041 TaxID=703135 RepID=A0A2A9NBH3_9AGAR|nr:hypothetical protein AMATHDRAFT_10122 [Amanita thiersii Skay4041]
MVVMRNFASSDAASDCEEDADEVADDLIPSEDEDPRGSSHDSSNESSSDQFLSSNKTVQEIPDPQPLPGSFNKESDEPLAGPSQPR